MKEKPKTKPIDIILISSLFFLFFLSYQRIITGEKISKAKRIFFPLQRAKSHRDWSRLFVVSSLRWLFVWLLLLFSSDEEFVHHAFGDTCCWFDIDDVPKGQN